MTVEVTLECDAWRAFGLAQLAKTASDAALVHLGLSPEDWEISVLGCDDARISQLNADFREKPQATNVLSWPSQERGLGGGRAPMPPSGDPELGDIAISYETCVKEAISGNKSPENHVLHLIIHGVLHLLGYDHVEENDADLMEGIEIAILAELGVPNPYIG